jgi:hypothetical protein
MGKNHNVVFMDDLFICSNGVCLLMAFKKMNYCAECDLKICVFEINDPEFQPNWVLGDFRCPLLERKNENEGNKKIWEYDPVVDSVASGSMFWSGTNDEWPSELLKKKE